MLRAIQYYRFGLSLVCLLWMLQSRAVDSIAAASSYTPLTALSQYTQPWEFTSLIEDAELIDRSIFHASFDPQGNAWLSATDGLYFYDGFHWTKYNHTNGLPSDFIR